MKDEVQFLEYNDATVEWRGSMIPIKLKLNDKGISYRNPKIGTSELITPKEIEVVNWQRLAGGHGIRIFTSDGELHRFGGFKESEQSKITKCFKNLYNKTMTDKEFSVKGWNYGSTTFEGGVLAFNVASVPAFEIPLRYVSSCIAGKNEITMEFHQNEEAPVSLVEMRFHIPSSELAGEDPVENFKDRVLSRASVITITGDALATFTQIQCLTPRGRYDFKVYPSFIQLHGKTFDFKIPVKTVLGLFLLPHLDGRQHFFVISLDPPMKQGQTRYPYLILMFSNDERDDVELPLTDEELKQKYDGRLEKEYSGPQYEVMSRLYKGLCNRKIVTPGNFIGITGSPAVSCSYKAAAGYLYPLERGFIYIHKPPIHIRFDEVSAINFARSGSTTRSFDLEIECRNGTVYTFSSIEKGEYGKLHEYVTAKKLRVKDRGGKMGAVSQNDDTEDVNDPYMRRVQDEAKQREEDESEEDSDFNPGEEGSDIAEEFDSNASSSSSADNSDTEKKPKEVVEEKKPKKVKTVSEKPRKRRAKKEKDENRPKRPQSGYFLWLNENREKIKKEFPGISITEISKKAGVMWKDVTDRTEWDLKAAEEKKKYEVAMKEYNSSLAESKDNPTTKVSSPKVSAPKVSASKGAIAKKTIVSSPTKAGSGSGFKSKEYIDESSESSVDSDDEPLEKLKSPAKPVKKEDASSEEEQMEIDESTGAESN